MADNGKGVKPVEGRTLDKKAEAEAPSASSVDEEEKELERLEREAVEKARRAGGCRTCRV